MSVFTTSVWTCEHCGEIAETTADSLFNNSPQLPPGWSHVVYGGPACSFECGDALVAKRAKGVAWRQAQGERKAATE